MLTQSQEFLDNLGDAYFRRNKDSFGHKDFIGSCLDQSGIKPRAILEIGCANGWRLKRYKEKYGCEVRGIEPSREAIEAADPSIREFISVGTAARIPYEANSFDMVIFGFCLYLCESQDWFKIVSESDRVLEDDGHIVINDWASARPIRVMLKEGYAFVIDHRNLWLGSPAYRVVVDSTTFSKLDTSVLETVSVLQKKAGILFPEAI
jgi:ubiquinone/menaquinone biosynthesis C-methylase UbiE